MTKFRNGALVAAICGTVAAVALAGCGGSSSADKTASSGATQSSAMASTSSVAAGTVSTASTSLGTVLVGEGGKTLYLFEKDKNGKSSCEGGCATAWPPATASGTPQVSGKAEKSLVSTVKRSDGGEQLVYNGHPLYFFEGDKAAGDVTGNGVDGFGAEWYALTPAGKSVGDAGDSSSSGDSDSSSSGSGGY